MGKKDNSNYITIISKISVICVGLVFAIYGYSLMKDSKVIDKKVEKEKSIDLFGSYNHQFKGELFWSNLLYLSFLSKVNIKFDFFIRLGEYSPKFAVRKLIGLNENGNNEILKKYVSYDNLINELIKKNGS